MSEKRAVEVEPCPQETSQTEDPSSEGNPPTDLRPEFKNRAWEDYINDFLIRSDHVTEAAIIDKDSGMYLASSSGFQLYEDEFAQILQSLSVSELAYRNGVTVNDKFYKTRLADGTRGIFARTDSDGCTVCKTSALVIIGVHDENCVPRRCNEEVMRLGDYLFAKGL